MQISDLIGEIALESHQTVGPPHEFVPISLQESYYSFTSSRLLGPPCSNARNPFSSAVDLCFSRFAAEVFVTIGRIVYPFVVGILRYRYSNLVFNNHFRIRRLQPTHTSHGRCRRYFSFHQCTWSANVICALLQWLTS
jgi:hypothetical protein